MVHPAAGAEWERARRRHRAWWGPDADGVVTTGAAKASVALAAPDLPTPTEMLQHNTDGLARLADHDGTRAAWRACPPGAGAAPACRITVHRRRQVTIRRPLGSSSSSARPLGALAVGTAVGAVAAATVTAVLWPVAALLGVATAAVAVRSMPRRRGTDDGALWVAIGTAVREGLVAAGSSDLAAVDVRVSQSPNGVQVALERHCPSGATWADALAEMLGPVGTPRWVLCVDDEVWRVPTAVGATRAAVDAFTAAVRRRLPHAVVHRAGTPEATAAVLRAAARRRDEVDITRRWR
jgi:hypothetical protein